jgi:hypothetical protein
MPFTLFIRFGLVESFSEIGFVGVHVDDVPLVAPDVEVEVVELDVDVVVVFLEPWVDPAVVPEPVALVFGA